MHRAFEQTLRQHQEHIRSERELAHTKDAAKKDAARAEQNLQEYIKAHYAELQEIWRRREQDEPEDLRQLRERVRLSKNHLKDQETAGRAFKDQRNAFLREQAKTARVSFDHEYITYKIQAEKDTILQALRQDFRNIEAGHGAKNLYPDAFRTWFDPEQNQLLVSWNGQTLPLTIGALIADLTWGIHYHLDAKTVPKHVQKRYAFEVAKARISLLAEEQMRIHEGNSLNIEEYERNIIKGSRSEQGEAPGFGIEAEYTVFTLIKSLSLDANTSFFPIHRDPYHDAIFKSDIVLSIPSTSRTNDARAVSGVLPREGYQITLSSNNGRIKRKEIKEAEKQLGENLRTIHFVPLKKQRETLTQAYISWKRARRPPGGPLRFLDQTTVIEIFDFLTKDIVREEERVRVHAFLRQTYPAQPPVVPETNAKATLSRERQKISHTSLPSRRQQAQISNEVLEKEKLRITAFWTRTKKALTDFSEEVRSFRSALSSSFMHGRSGFDQAYQRIQDLITQGEELADRKEKIAYEYARFRDMKPGGLDKFLTLKKEMDELARLASTCALGARAYEEERQHLHELGDEYLYELEEQETGSIKTVLNLYRKGAPISSDHFSRIAGYFSHQIQKILTRLDQSIKIGSSEEMNQYATALARYAILLQMIHRIEKLSPPSNATS
ncbi:hypothetical protein KBB27_04270 [Patescibacteria group bacterium]|nr:hypothetical protein [Patescibacteria group bacterium]